MSAFDVENPFWRFMNKMADQFLLSLLWMLCSIPIITFGASTTAFITSAMKLHKDVESSIKKDFFSAFRLYFKRSTLMWLTHLGIALVLAADLWFCWYMKTSFSMLMLAVIAILALLLLMASFYTWPLISHTDGGVLTIWKAAMHLMITFLPHSLSMLVLAVLGGLVVCLSPGLAILVPFIVCYQYARVFVWAFARDPLTREALNESAQYCIPGAESAENDKNLKTED